MNAICKNLTKVNKANEHQFNIAVCVHNTKQGLVYTYALGEILYTTNSSNKHVIKYSYGIANIDWTIAEQTARGKEIRTNPVKNCSQIACVPVLYLNHKIMLLFCKQLSLIYAGTQLLRNLSLNVRKHSEIYFGSVNCLVVIVVSGSQSSSLS